MKPTDKRLKALEVAAGQHGQDPHEALAADVERWREAGENSDLIAAFDKTSDERLVALATTKPGERYSLIRLGADDAKL